MRKALLDTDIFSYVIDHRYPEVVATAQQYIRVHRYFSISAITVTETLKGLHLASGDQKAEGFLTFLEDCEVLSLEVEEAILAAEILAGLTRRGQKIGDLDPFIAAIAIQNMLPLVTNNTKHYQRIIDLGFPLELENWRQEL